MERDKKVLLQGEREVRRPHVNQRRETEAYRLLLCVGLMLKPWQEERKDLICHVIVLAQLLPAIHFSVFAYTLKIKFLCRFQPCVYRNCTSIPEDNLPLTL